MQRKVMFNKSGSGSVNAKVIIPVAYLEVLGITEEERDIDVKLVGKKIVITKLK